MLCLSHLAPRLPPAFVPPTPRLSPFQRSLPGPKLRPCTRLGLSELACSLLPGDAAPSSNAGSCPPLLTSLLPPFCSLLPLLPLLRSAAPPSPSSFASPSFSLRFAPSLSFLLSTPSSLSFPCWTVPTPFLLPPPPLPFLPSLQPLSLSFPIVAPVPFSSFLHSLLCSLSFLLPLPIPSPALSHSVHTMIFSLRGSHASHEKYFSSFFSFLFFRLFHSLRETASKAPYDKAFRMTAIHISLVFSVYYRSKIRNDRQRVKTLSIQKEELQAMPNEY